MQKLHLGITSAGRRVELLHSLRTDARSLNYEIDVTAIDVNPHLSAACAVAEHVHAVPRCTEPDYIEQLLQICSSTGVQILIPTIYTEFQVLAENRDLFAKNGTKIVVSDEEAIRVARDKNLTARVLHQAKIPSPKTLLLTELLQEKQSINYPVVLKRIDGSSSIGLCFSENLAEINALRLDESSYIAQEKCLGPEYTINCYVDQQGCLRAAVSHRRIETRGGEVSKGVTERRADLHQLAHQIVKALPGLRGPFCFQAILTKEGPVVFEINARFGGGYPLAHAAGATFGKWLMQETLGMHCTANDDWQDGLLMLRYDAAVFKKVT